MVTGNAPASALLDAAGPASSAVSAEPVLQAVSGSAARAVATARRREGRRGTAASFELGGAYLGKPNHIPGSTGKSPSDRRRSRVHTAGRRSRLSAVPWPTWDQAAVACLVALLLARAALWLPAGHVRTASPP